MDMRQRGFTVYVGSHQLTWIAQALTDDDGRVVIEENLGFRFDGRPLTDSHGEKLLKRLGYI
jgi:hypothetical protein